MGINCFLLLSVEKKQKKKLGHFQDYNKNYHKKVIEKILKFTILLVVVSATIHCSNFSIEWTVIKNTEKKNPLQSLRTKSQKYNSTQCANAAPHLLPSEKLLSTSSFASHSIHLQKV